MKIIVAEHAGFCFGVKRAVSIVEEQIAANPGRRIYTDGPIIHNETVVNDFKKQGVEVMDETEDASSYEKGIVILRSHGVSQKMQEGIENAGHTTVDATCPFVKKIHNLAMEASKNGDYIIIIGDRNHPEIQGVCGWIQGNDYSCIQTEEEARNFTLKDKSRKITLLSQTTFNHKKFHELVEILNQKGYDINALNTICNATQERQDEAARIAGEVDVCLVIGGRNSSNTRKLYDICRQKCPDTYFLETADDLDPQALESASSVGITAGASTPAKIIQEVISKCQK
ncbi:MAG: 4-hydroxy-3-methylbut-2-enyl diphosphate reductase [Lachnospiraceae bacterium]|uniref:4-hydroxy-3-methylbut-2-enyl diphosphate reductase n=1 Tax=Candidatus Weimeria bifida TaxID=2599074 RepID=A0A6N7IYE0_9FIRM|nr:4-hydroxy-3-methylbut-2-enyl diphosphate reductase [Candidatus Weimeria bifida]RRF96025.1 MAG: 4-hydroxy-3-methylbut-2-enyl diphosphate reductase [Lachnospiraceae bacterium]